MRMLDVLYVRYTFLLTKTIPLKIIITSALKATNRVKAARHVKELSPIFLRFFFGSVLKENIYLNGSFLIIIITPA